jgi:tRNA (cytosine38-C5)-methyltransferase
MSILAPLDRVSFCFTSGYGHVMHKSSGSLVHDTLAEPVEKKPLDRTEGMGIYSGKIRFFSPKEVLNVMGFPQDFAFPPELSLRQSWQLAGQSVNIFVVRLLMRRLLLSGGEPLPPRPTGAELSSPQLIGFGMKGKG